MPEAKESHSMMAIWTATMIVHIKMASEAANGPGNELRDLHYSYSSAYSISLSLKSLFSPAGGEGGNKIDL